MDRRAALHLGFIPSPAVSPSPPSPHLKSPSFYKTRRPYTPPRKYPRTRLAYLALLILVGLGVYIFYLKPASVEVRDAPSVLSHYTIVAPLAKPHHHIHTQSAIPTTTRLTQKQQLAALTSFILSPLHSNSLPSSVASPDDLLIDDLLEFSLDSSRADEMLEEMVKEVWDEERVVVFGKHNHPPTRNLITLLRTWKFPHPSIIELDTRQDGRILESLLRRLAVPSTLHMHSRSIDELDLPLLLLRGTPIFGLDTIKQLKESGELETLLGHELASRP
ncbi:hypothetical protein DL96DRAFT_719707 [Flagelloscypha sp. PMI_526]|nr:hypothetical protein DL96DRAFT_719707 [Flagelloscypha sp. PMI_526]